MEDIKLAVFDIAGTTAKDDGLVLSAFKVAATRLGIEQGSSRMRDMIRYVKETMGQRKMDVFNHLFLGDSSKASLAHEVFVANYIKMVEDGKLEEFEGVSKLFANLKLNGVGVAITTGFPRTILEKIIESLEWETLIDVSVASSEVANGRPSPDMIFKSIERYTTRSGLKFSTSEVAVIGDTVSDIQSGILAGAKYVIGVCSGAHSKSELLNAGATHVFDSVTEILTVIN
jgi:phosphoglycolate phosphatase